MSIIKNYWIAYCIFPIILALFLFVSLFSALDAFSAERDSSVKNEMDHLWDFTGINWNLCTRGMRDQVLTDEAIEKRISYLKGLGINTVFMNGLHFRLCFLDREERTLAYLKKVTSICHKHGMKVIEHLDLTIPLYLGTADMLKHPEWLQVDARYGATVARWYCFNNLEYQKWSIDYLVNLLKETDVDGFSIDEVNYSVSRTKEEVFCGCKYCREKFKADTGINLSKDTNSSFWKNYSNSEWRQYVKWRITSNRDYLTNVSNELRKVKPGVFFTGYSTNFAIVFARDHGSCMWEMSKVPNMFNGIEIWWKLSNSYSFPFIMSDLKLHSAIADHWHRPAWMIISPDSDETYIFTWAMTRMAKFRPWLNKSYIPEGQMKESLSLPPLMDDSNSRIFTDIGVLFSVQSRDAYKESSEQAYPVIGWLEFMIMNNIQADALMDDDINEKNIKKYKTLLLPNSSTLSENQIEVIIDFMKKGGSVIATMEPGKFNKKGEPVENNLFFSSVGLTYLGVEQGKFKLLPEPSWYRENFNMEVNDRFTRFANSDNEKSEILMELEYKNKKFPALIMKNIGEGKLVYSALKLGNLYFISDGLKGNKVPKWNGEEAAPLLKKILMTSRKAELTSIPVQVSKGLVYYIYENSSDSSLIVQTLNTSGRESMLKEGDIIKEKISYPQVKDMIADIMFPGEKPPKVSVFVGKKRETLKCERIDKNYIRLIVPGEMLNMYSIIKIEKGE